MRRRRRGRRWRRRRGGRCRRRRRGRRRRRREKGNCNCSLLSNIFFHWVSQVIGHRNKESSRGMETRKRIFDDRNFEKTNFCQGGTRSCFRLLLCWKSNAKITMMSVRSVCTYVRRFQHRRPVAGEEETDRPPLFLPPTSSIRPSTKIAAGRKKSLWKIRHPSLSSHSPHHATRARKRNRWHQKFTFASSLIKNAFCFKYLVGERGKGERIKRGRDLEGGGLRSSSSSKSLCLTKQNEDRRRAEMAHAQNGGGFFISF